MEPSQRQRRRQWRRQLSSSSSSRRRGQPYRKPSVTQASRGLLRRRPCGGGGSLIETSATSSSTAARRCVGMTMAGGDGGSARPILSCGERESRAAVAAKVFEPLGAGSVLPWRRPDSARSWRGRVCDRLADVGPAGRPGPVFAPTKRPGDRDRRRPRPATSAITDALGNQAAYGYDLPAVTKGASHRGQLLI